MRKAPHTLDDQGEALIAKFSLMDNAGGSAYTILTNADIPWPKVKLSTGEEITLDASAYTKYRELPNRDDRKKVMDSFFGTFKTYERTLGVDLYSQLKQETVYAKVRKYPDSITRSLDRNNVPVAVFDALIAQTNANLPTLHRYFRLRAKMLGVPQLHYYDIYPPLVHSDIKLPFDVGRKLVLEAVAPLGKDYVDAMAYGFDHRWMDTYPRPRKLSGAHMDGYAYDVHPYVLMNYNDDYESVTTVAHEWGHAMHSFLANKAQPFVTSNYAIFVAEIASTFNEELLLQRVLKTAKTDNERLYYLGYALEQLRGTFFRQAMFAEFERSIHARVDKGEPLTGEDLLRDTQALPRRQRRRGRHRRCLLRRVGVHPALLQQLLRLPVRDLDRGERAVRAARRRERARRSVPLPRPAQGGRVRLSVRAGEKSRGGSGHAGALSGARRADEFDHGRDRGHSGQAEEVAAQSPHPGQRPA